MRFSSVATFALAAAAGLVGFAAAASAADLPEYPVFIETPEPLPIPTAGGWYLRGDIGYKIYSNPKMVYDNGTANYNSTTGQMWHEDLEDTFLVGVGAGYKVNEYLRLDATLDYEFDAKGSGRLVCYAPCLPAEYSSEHYKLDAWTGLVNAYIDLGTYYGLTPYIGAGIGASYLTTSHVTSQNPHSPQDNHSGDSSWNFAYALMAGAAYSVTDNIMIDVNYRYMDLGDAKSGPITAAGGTAPIRYNDITAHEIRMGVRYNLF